MSTGQPPARRRVWAAVALLTALLLVVLGPVRSFAERHAYPLRHTETVEAWAAEYGVDPYLVYAVIRTESGFDARAESKAGARGLMQMTEDTFNWLKTRLAPGEDIVFDDLYRPDVSVRFGVYFLSLCLARYGGDVPTAAAAYHSGWGTVDRLLQEEAHSADGERLAAFPYRQMRHYVNKVTTTYRRYGAIYGGKA